jgi:hypothetical protein
VIASRESSDISPYKRLIISLDRVDGEDRVVR